MNKFFLEVLTPDSDFFEGEAESVVFKADDGQYCVLAGHAHTFATVDAGILKISDGESERRAVCTDGFAEIDPQKMRVFLESCEWENPTDNQV